MDSKKVPTLLFKIIPGLFCWMNGRKREAIVWALVFYILLVMVAFAIILAPFPWSLLLALFAFALYFRRMTLTREKTSTIIYRSGLTIGAYALSFLFLLYGEIVIIQKNILFGYKAVSREMAPVLVPGDHYFGEKVFYRIRGPRKGEIYVHRTKDSDVRARRIVAVPGEEVRSEGGLLRQLKPGEYLLATDSREEIQEVVPLTRFMARAFMNYWTFDAGRGKVLWERIGRIIK